METQSVPGRLMKDFLDLPEIKELLETVINKCEKAKRATSFKSGTFGLFLVIATMGVTGMFPAHMFSTYLQN